MSQIFQNQSEGAKSDELYEYKLIDFCFLYWEIVSTDMDGLTDLRLKDRSMVR